MRRLKPQRSLRTQAAGLTERERSGEQLCGVAAGELYRFAADVLKHGTVESVQMHRGNALGKTKSGELVYDDAFEHSGLQGAPL